MSEEGEGALGQEEREGDEVEAGQAGGESLVVPREAAEARGPRERALDDQGYTGAGATRSRAWPQGP